jgi:hypothetical protein
LVIVIATAALAVPVVTAPKASEFGLADNDAAGSAVPVPDKAIDIVRPPPVIVYVLLALAATVGLNVKTTVQEEPAFSVALLQVPERTKLAGAAG